MLRIIDIHLSEPKRRGCKSQKDTYTKIDLLVSLKQYFDESMKKVHQQHLNIGENHNCTQKQGFQLNKVLKIAYHFMFSSRALETITL